MLPDMWLGWMEFDLLLGDVHSLKHKRSLVRPLIADLRRVFSLSVAEVGHLDLHRRSSVGVAIVGGDSSHVQRVLDAAEEFVATRPELVLLSAKRGLRTSDDD
jgi:uncharacterized protein YlxP (DUF503 family)